MMSGLDLLWNIEQEERISKLEKELREHKEHIERLSQWVIFLIKAQYNVIEAHDDTESNRGSTV